MAIVSTRAVATSGSDGVCLRRYIGMGVGSRPLRRRLTRWDAAPFTTVFVSGSFARTPSAPEVEFDALWDTLGHLVR